MAPRAPVRIPDFVRVSGGASFMMAMFVRASADRMSFQKSASSGAGSSTMRCEVLADRRVASRSIPQGHADRGVAGHEPRVVGVISAEADRFVGALLHALERVVRVAPRGSTWASRFQQPACRERRSGVGPTALVSQSSLLSESWITAMAFAEFLPSSGSLAILPDGVSGAEIGELLDSSQFEGGFFVLDGRRIKIDRLGQIVEFRARLPERRAERRRLKPALPLRFVLDFDEPVSLGVQIALQADVHVSANLLGGRDRLGDADELVAVVRGPGRALFTTRKAIVRVAVALEGAPGVVVRLRFVGGPSGMQRRLAEVLAVEHLRIEAQAERLGAVVVDLPAGDDDAAHAELDQLHGDAGRQFRPPLKALLPGLVFGRRVDLAEVAAIDEKYARG